MLSIAIAAAPAEAQSVITSLARARILRRWDAAAAQQLCARLAALEAAPAQAETMRAALGHARRRDRLMRQARERRAVPFLAEEVGRCVRCARAENRALLRTLRLMATEARQRSLVSQQPPPCGGRV
jgi:hypothetical protein